MSDGDRLEERLPAALRALESAEPPADLADRAFRAAMAAPDRAGSFWDALFPVAWRAAAAAAVVAAGLSIAAISSPAAALEPDLVASIEPSLASDRIAASILGIAADGGGRVPRPTGGGRRPEHPEDEP